MEAPDQKTADAFASSWNHLPSGSVYTTEQFEDWMAPVTRADAEGKRVLELGCGNASILLHMATWMPKYLEGVDLGDSVETARRNMQKTGLPAWKVTKADLTTFSEGRFDLVYCIGVLHHLRDPLAGFLSILRNTISGGKFHVWVYAREGNAIVRFVVDPIRKVTSHLPWQVTKWVIAFPLAFPFYGYAKVVSFLPEGRAADALPLAAYSRWIAKREFSFFHHVAFDQLVTPQTAYIPKTMIERWLRETPGIVPGSTYIVMRNGNSWKFGGVKA